MSENIVHVTDASFEADVLQSKTKPLLWLTSGLSGAVPAK